MMKTKATTRMVQETMGTLALMGLGTGMASTISMLGMVAMTTGLVATVTGKTPRTGIYPLPGRQDTPAGNG